MLCRGGRLPAAVHIRHQPVQAEEAVLQQGVHRAVHRPLREVRRVLLLLHAHGVRDELPGEADAPEDQGRGQGARAEEDRGADGEGRRAGQALPRARLPPERDRARPEGRVHQEHHRQRRLYQRGEQKAYRELYRTIREIHASFPS